jgi:hypothetical protein
MAAQWWPTAAHGGPREIYLLFFCGETVGIREEDGVIKDITRDDPHLLTHGRHSSVRHFSLKNNGMQDEIITMLLPNRPPLFMPSPSLGSYNGGLLSLVDFGIEELAT